MRPTAIINLGTDNRVHMKYTKPLFILAAILFLGYHSVEIKRLDEAKEAEAEFDAVSYARAYLEESLPTAYDQAVSLSELTAMIRADKDKTFAEHSHAVSIGNLRHFLVRGTGQVATIHEDELELVLSEETPTPSVRLATEFIYGSSIRDAAGLFDIRKFTNNTDMNNVSVAINTIIKEEVVAPFKTSIQEGDRIQFIGALELNQKFPQLESLEILPIQLQISKLDE